MPARCFYCILLSILVNAKPEEENDEINKRAVMQIKARKRSGWTDLFHEFEARDGGVYDLALSGIQFVMQYKIVSKLEIAGATSEERAVTIEKADFTPEEQQWLTYVTGGFFSRVRKTRDRRYYIH